jgi:hypothetical protein
LGLAKTQARLGCEPRREVVAQAEMISRERY